MTDTSNDHESIQNRSEIAFVIDAKDTNPNGDPLSDTNEPRIDDVTGQCVVTDVRLKRYIRDQLDEDGHTILIKNPDDDVLSRKEMYEGVEEAMDVAIDEIEPAELIRGFVKTAADVRYFGATISVDNDLSDELPPQFEGPVQFNHGRSYHEVDRNTESRRLATVIANPDDSAEGNKKEQGTFADDHRISYGVIGFGGRINEHAASDTYLTEDDVKRLDTLCWRAIKNQTNTRSKAGQQPLFYVRVEYVEDGFEIGRLNNRIDIRSDKPENEIRGTDEFQLDVTELLTALADHQNRIDTVYATANDLVTFTVPGEDGPTAVDQDGLYETLERTFDESDVTVETYDVYERYNN